jgi:AmmeMemoRadiSam system protein A
MSEYSPEERKQLLTLAHQSIQSQLQGRSLRVQPPSAHLSELRGAFTTLHLHGKLRGCIGYVVAHSPLYEAVIDTASAAAFEDPRFEPVREDEAADLQVEISVLSRMFPIAPEDVEIGRHGLMISQYGRRGLLLPQVPLEWGWDRETFLSQTCQKAGLQLDAWKRGAKIQAFTAEVFGETVAEESLKK